MPLDPKAVDGIKETTRFAKLAFDDFKRLADDKSLSDHEKIGAGDAYRAGFGEAIWADVHAKLQLGRPNLRILDIGPGCADLPRALIANAESLNQTAVLVDHKEMLERLPASPAVTAVEGRFPDHLPPDGGVYDAILIYAVLQVVIYDGNPFFFIDEALRRLAPGGRLLIGDIPNISKLRRFLASEAGVAHHKAYMRTDEPPVVEAFADPADRIDDGLVFGLLARARAAGFDAYLLPQPSELPMANRREDILVMRP